MPYPITATDIDCTIILAAIAENKLDALPEWTHYGSKSYLRLTVDEAGKSVVILREDGHYHVFAEPMATTAKTQIADFMRQRETDACGLEEPLTRDELATLVGTLCAGRTKATPIDKKAIKETRAAAESVYGAHWRHKCGYAETKGSAKTSEQWQELSQRRSTIAKAGSLPPL